MVYGVEVTDTAQKEIARNLEKHQIKMLDKKIQKLREDPQFYGKPLRHPLSGVWEFRLEKRYRVLYRIDQVNKVIYVVGFKHKDDMEKLSSV